MALSTPSFLTCSLWPVNMVHGSTAIGLDKIAAAPG